jgi:hypothetical protein
MGGAPRKSFPFVPGFGTPDREPEMLSESRNALKTHELTHRG